MTPDDVRRLVRDDPPDTALAFDFDGTLAPIVDDPAAAGPMLGVVELLDALATRFGRVAVVSGRPRSFLAGHFPGPAVDLSGLYGLETRIDGIDADHPEADRWRPVVDDASASAAAELPPTVTVEAKGLSLTVHFRSHPPDRAGVVEWAERTSIDGGLEVREAKASVELHPPLDVDKGTSLTALAAGCTTVVYVGDDLGDLPAFAALDELRRGGVRTVKVATGGAELPAEVAAAADLVVDGPEAVVDLFRPLV